MVSGQFLFAAGFFLAVFLITAGLFWLSLQQDTTAATTDTSRADDADTGLDN